jgi:transcriptional regulator with PAS, ATPase and Fis domain
MAPKERRVPVTDATVRSHAPASPDTAVPDAWSARGLVGVSTPWREVLRFVESSARLPTTVLVRGESGTGKERVAQAIHALSPRGPAPFVPVNCGALPEGLLESELFGHRAGSFTGALRDRRGLFEVADGGTLFLDEIGDAPTSLQVRLLRVLEEGEVRRIGDGATRRVDVRVIAATHRPLRRWAREGRFREDLFFRLNVLSIDIPPLRHRTEDVLPLAHHLLERLCHRLRRKVPELTPEAATMLVSYPWPGNVRELENELERALVLTPPSRPLKPRAFSAGVRFHDGGDTDSRAGTLRERLDAVERGLIMETLCSWNGNQTRAAQALGLSRQGLIKKIRRHELRVPKGPSRATGRGAGRVGGADMV